MAIASAPGFTPAVWLEKVWMPELQKNASFQVCSVLQGWEPWWDWNYRNFYHEHAQPLEEGHREAVAPLPLEVFPT